MTVGKKMIIIYNKTDLDEAVGIDKLCKLLEEAGHSSDDHSILPVSLKEDADISSITDKIKELYNLGSIRESNEIMLTNLRHKEAIEKAMKSLDNVRKGIESSVPEDMLTIDMMDAYAFLGQVIGESVDEDLIDAVFSRFCLGK